MKTKVMILVIGLLVINPSSQAVILTYLDVNGSEDSPRGLYNFDTITGLSTLRTSISSEENFLTFAPHPSNGKIYASEGNFSGLHEVDIFSGDTSFIGQPGYAQFYSSLAFDPTSEELYAIVGGARLGGFSYSLVYVDQTTGKYNKIGDTHDCIKLAISDTGELFGLISTDSLNNGPGVRGDLFRIDKKTGNFTFVGGKTPFTAGSADAIFTDGYIYSTDWNGNFFKTDPETGEGVLIGNTGMGDGLGGLFVPEPSSLALVGLGVMLLRKRKRSLT